ncbi:MAG: hypothetical protein ACREDV_02565 [Methylocella sp.]
MIRKHQLAARSRAAALILAVSIPSTAPAHAQMLVFDPSNYSQNLLTAARALQQIENQIKSLQNEAQMLINEAKHLEQLPTSVLNDVERDYAQIQNLLKQANGITYNVQSINTAFSQRYPAATFALARAVEAAARWKTRGARGQGSRRAGRQGQ